MDIFKKTNSEAAQEWAQFLSINDVSGLSLQDLIPEQCELCMVSVNPKQAAYLLAVLHFSPELEKVQRDRKPTKIGAYGSFMSNGTFVNNGLIEIVEYQGRLIVTNGLQRLTSQIISQTTQTYLCVLIRKAKSLEQVRQRYLIHDKGTPRSTKDDGKALGLVQEGENTSVMSAIVSAGRSLMQNGGTTHATQSTSDIDKQRIMQDFSGVSDFFNACIKGDFPDNGDNKCDKETLRKLLTTAIFPAVMAQFVAYPEEAQAFYRDILMRNGSSSTQARDAQRWLQSLGKIRGHANKMFMHNMCELFNAYLANAQTGETYRPDIHKRVHDKFKYILHILGTPFGKKLSTKKSRKDYGYDDNVEFLELYYSTNRTAESEYDLEVGCFRPYNQIRDMAKYKDQSSLVKEQIEKAGEELFANNHQVVFSEMADGIGIANTAE